MSEATPIDATIITSAQDAELREEYATSGSGTDYFTWRSGQFENPRVLVQELAATEEVPE